MFSPFGISSLRKQLIWWIFLDLCPPLYEQSLFCFICMYACSLFKLSWYYMFFLFFPYIYRTLLWSRNLIWGLIIRKFNEYFKLESQMELIWEINKFSSLYLEGNSYCMHKHCDRDIWQAMNKCSSWCHFPLSIWWSFGNHEYYDYISHFGYSYAFGMLK